MKMYALITKDNNSGCYVLFESDNLVMVYDKYIKWCNILPKGYFAVYKQLESRSFY